MNGIKNILHFLSVKKLFVTAAVLLMLVLITFGMIVGLYAKMSQHDENSDTAAVATGGTASVYEHEAEVVLNRIEVTNGIYKLNYNKKTTSNCYPTVVPGTVIPKDPFIEFSGTNDTACYLYLEVKDNFPDEINYSLTKGLWKETNAFQARHGGTVYVYCSGSLSSLVPREIEPHRTEKISDIIYGNKLFVSEYFKDITEPEKNSEPYQMEFYVYLVQKD